MRPLFSILHTSGRPHGWRKAYEAWLLRADNPSEVEYVLCADERWGFTPDSIAHFADERQGLNKLVWNRGRKCAVDGWNTAFAASTGKILYAGADDVNPWDQWDRTILQLVGDLDPLTVDFAIRLRSKNPNQSRDLFPTMLSRARAERIGYYFYPAYESMYSDDDVCEHIKLDLTDGRTVLLDSSPMMLCEENPFVTGIPMDEVYRHQNKPEAYALGRRILAARRQAKFADLLPAAVQTVGRTIAVCLPGEQFSAAWLCNWSELLPHCMQLGLSVACHFGYSSSPYVTRASLAESVMSMDPKPDYVLWLDDDQILSPAKFDLLLNDLDQLPEADMVAAWTWIQAETETDARVSAGTYSETTSEVSHIPPVEIQRVEGLIEVEWTGFPAVLMRYHALDKAGRQPFAPISAPNSRWGWTGEDISFCVNLKARSHGRIFVDSRVFVPHLKLRSIGPQAVKAKEQGVLV